MRREGMRAAAPCGGRIGTALDRAASLICFRGCSVRAPPAHRSSCTGWTSSGPSHSHGTVRAGEPGCEPACGGAALPRKCLKFRPQHAAAAQPPFVPPNFRPRPNPAHSAPGSHSGTMTSVAIQKRMPMPPPPPPPPTPRVPGPALPLPASPTEARAAVPRSFVWAVVPTMVAVLVLAFAIDIYMIFSHTSQVRIHTRTCVNIRGVNRRCVRGGGGSRSAGLVTRDHTAIYL